MTQGLGSFDLGVIGIAGREGRLRFRGSGFRV